MRRAFPTLNRSSGLRTQSTYGGVTCEIVNFSVNRVDDCEVAFNILPPDAKPKFESYQFVEKLEPFSERATFSLARAMDALGMDADAIAAIETMHDDDPSREAIIAASAAGAWPILKVREDDGGGEVCLWPDRRRSSNRVDGPFGCQADEAREVSVSQMLLPVRGGDGRRGGAIGRIRCFIGNRR